jgi:hypothetical protein
MAELERWVPRDKREHKVTFSVPRVVRSLNWKFAPKGFYDDIVRARVSWQIAQALTSN